MGTREQGTKRPVNSFSWCKLCLWLGPAPVGSVLKCPRAHCTMISS